MKKLAIVRRIGFRPFDINFFEHINRFEVEFIHALPELDTTIRSIQLKPQSLLPIDPTMLFGKKHALINLTSWAYLRDLEKHLEQVDFINTIETYFFPSKQCAEIARKLKKPLIISVAQNMVNHPSRFVPPYCWNSRTVIQNANLFIAMTHRAKSYLLSLSIKENKIKVIYPGIDTSNFYPDELKRGDRPRILFVGNLYESKGLPELLEASAHLHEDGFDHELWICGRGHLEYLVHKYAQKYPIIYLKHVDYVSMPEIYRKCDIFCLPSHDYRVFGIKVGEEQFGFVFLEAMSSALPIVTSMIGSIPEVVGSENHVVKKGSVKQLYFALKNLICNEKARVSLGRENRVRVEKFFEVRQQSLKFQNEIDKI